jgi:hypothetical protein
MQNLANEYAATRTQSPPAWAEGQGTQNLANEFEATRTQSPPTWAEGHGALWIARSEIE